MELSSDTLPNLAALCILIIKPRRIKMNINQVERLYIRTTIIQLWKLFAEFLKTRDILNS